LLLFVAFAFHGSSRCEYMLACVSHCPSCGSNSTLGWPGADLTQLNAVIGPAVEREDLASINADVLTPEHELYDDNNDSVGAVPDIKLVKPECRMDILVQK
jgi:hypothetical protein